MLVLDMARCLSRSTPLCCCVPWKADQCAPRNPGFQWGSAMESNSRRFGRVRKRVKSGSGDFPWYTQG